MVISKYVFFVYISVPLLTTLLVHVMSVYVVKEICLIIIKLIGQIVLEISMMIQC